MTSKIVYIYFNDNEIYKVNIYDLRYDLFLKILDIGNNDGYQIHKFVKLKYKYTEIRIDEIIRISDFVQFILINNSQFEIEKIYTNFTIFDENELLELIIFFEKYNEMTKKWKMKKPFYKDNLVLIDDLKKNYKKYLNEANIKTIIE